MAEEDEPGSTNPVDQERIRQARMFKEDWMNKAYAKVAFPNPKCEKVLAKINGVLAKKLKPDKADKAKEQALYLLLGKDFVAKHFPEATYDPSVLEPPNMDPKEKAKHIAKAKSYLDDKRNEATQELGWPNDLSNYEGDDELGEYLQEVRSVYKNALEEHIQKEHEHWEGQPEPQPQKTSRKRKGFYAPSRKEQEKQEGPLGRTLLAMITYDPVKMTPKVLGPFRDNVQMMPLPLRQFMWLDFLLKEEMQQPQLKKDHVTLESELKEKYKAPLDRNVKLQKLERATRSNEWKEIDRRVIEVYEKSSGLKNLDDDEHMIQTSRVMNMLHVINGGVSSLQCYWLCPMQGTYGMPLDEEKDQDMLKLAVYLDLVSKHCQPPSQDTFKLADTIMTQLEKQDPKYAEHLITAAKTKIGKPHPVDFHVEIISTNPREAEATHNHLTKGKELTEDEERVFGDPKIFIRKWIAEGFVGVLSPNGVSLTWDQLFLRGWSSNAIVHVAMAILGLIKPWMLRATGWSGVKKVFLEEPSKLYTKDLKEAYKHTFSGGKLEGIPPNKNFIPPPKSKTPPPKEKTPPPTPPPKKPLSPAPKPKTPLAPRPIPIPVPLDLNINLESDDEDAEPLPIPEPPPDTPTPPPTPPPPREPTPPPPKPPTPPPKPPTPPPREPTPPPPKPETPPPDHAWVKYNRSKVERGLPEATAIFKTFDFYIDGVRFLPENIKLCKVTGRFFNMNLGKGQELQAPISAYPQVSSPGMTPKMEFRTSINKDGVIINPDVTCLLRLYGYEITTNRVVAMGSALIGIFNTNLPKPLLKVGGHQIRVHEGLPNPDGGIENLMDDDLDENPVIPGLTVLVRLLPSGGKEEPAPNYESGYYNSEPSDPTGSEDNLYDYYMSLPAYKTDVKACCHEIQKARKEKVIEDDAQLEKWIENTLDQKKEGAKPSNIDLVHFVTYDKKFGVAVLVEQAFSLAMYHDHRFTRAFVQILTSSEIKGFLGKSSEKTRFITEQIDINSPMRAPKWLDNPKILKPKYDEKAVLLIRLYGIPVTFKGRTGVAHREGKSFDIKLEMTMGWVVAPVFENKCVRQHSYTAPLLKGSVPEDVLLKFSQAAPGGMAAVYAEVLKSGKVKTHETGASIDFSVWDGRFSANESAGVSVRQWSETFDADDGAPFASNSELISEPKSVMEKAAKARTPGSLSKLEPFHTLILEHADQREKDQGPHGESYEKQKAIFEKECLKEFDKAFLLALQKSGQPVLDT